MDFFPEVNQLITQLNSEQRHIYDIIEHSISNESGYTFFIYGYGGTGKTFLWNTLLSSVRNKGKIALAVASSGIAALLLPGGQTPHSRFNLPLDIQEHSVCAIKKNTDRIADPTSYGSEVVGMVDRRTETGTPLGHRVHDLEGGGGG